MKNDMTLKFLKVCSISNVFWLANTSNENKRKNLICKRSKIIILYICCNQYNMIFVLQYVFLFHWTTTFLWYFCIFFLMKTCLFKFLKINNDLQCIKSFVETYIWKIAQRFFQSFFDCLIYIVLIFLKS